VIEYEIKGVKVPLKTLPKWVVTIAAVFNPEAKTAKEMVGKRIKLNNTRV
jgi:hypothetical protein